jgi:hypothetical protein
MASNESIWELQTLVLGASYAAARRQRSESKGFGWQLRTAPAGLNGLMLQQLLRLPLTLEKTGKEREGDAGWKI